MNRWITRSILAAATAAFFPIPLHADATQPASATRPSDDSTLNPFLNGQEERDMQKQFDQARRDLRGLQTIPSPTRIPSMTSPNNDPWSWGLLMVPAPSTRPMQSFQFNGLTVFIEPVAAQK